LWFFHLEVSFLQLSLKFPQPPAKSLHCLPDNTRAYRPAEVLFLLPVFHCLSVKSGLSSFVPDFTHCINFPARQITRFYETLDPESTALAPAQDLQKTLEYHPPIQPGSAAFLTFLYKL